MDWRGLATSLIVNAAIPYAVYQILTMRGYPLLTVLIVSAIVPGVFAAISLVRTRQADPIGVVVLVLIVIGVITSLISGNPTYILVKESLLTGLLGIACLVSMLLPRPAMFYIGRQFATGGDRVAVEWYTNLWQYQQFRFSQYLITLVWGIGFVLEAAVRVALVFLLPVSIFLAVSPIVALGITVALIAWTITYATSVRKRAAARQALRSQAKSS